MKLLKDWVKPFWILLVFFGFSQCNTKEVVQNNLPFTIEEKTIQSWVGGKEGSSGVNIVIGGGIKSNNIFFKKIYYKNFEKNIAPDFQNGKYSINSNFTFVKKDRKMSNDKLGEYGNEAPEIGKPNPFNLKENEAVLLYTLSGKEYYYKITDLKRLETIYYP